MSTIDLGRGWTETTEHAASSYGLPVYVRGGQSHSLEEALAAGMLREVRQARGLSCQALAVALGIHYNTLARWERGELHPMGLYRSALLRWLRGNDSDH